MDELMSVTETAERLGISPARVRYYVVKGRLRAQQVGRTWTLRKSDVESFAALPRNAGRPVRKACPGGDQ